VLRVAANGAEIVTACVHEAGGACMLRGQRLVKG
jgi:hypothetical protein